MNQIITKVGEFAQPRLLTRREAADYLAISQRKLDQLAADGLLKRVKFGSCIRFDPDDLDVFVAESKQG